MTTGDWEATPENEREVFALCAERLGKDWKLRVHKAWMDGHYPYEVKEVSWKLQRIRNTPGAGTVVWDAWQAYLRKPEGKRRKRTL